MATTVVPAPGLWEPDGGAGDRYVGLEAGLADALAEELGLDRVEVEQVAFARVVAGDLGGADVAIAALTPTDVRDRVLDFSSPYLAAPPAVLARPGTDGRDVRALRDLRWAVAEGSTFVDVLDEQVRPDAEVLLVEDRAAAVAAVHEGRVDATLVDLPVALGLAEDAPDDLAVVGHLGGDEGLAVALPDGADGLDAVDAAVRALVADGTVADLEAAWVGDAGSVPYVRSS